LTVPAIAAAALPAGLADPLLCATGLQAATTAAAADN
jgi:hypothetical protein